MKQGWFRIPYEKTSFSTASFIERCLDGQTYDRGELETLRATAENAVNALGRLVEILHSRKVLTRTDVYTIAGHSAPDDEAPEYLGREEDEYFGLDETEGDEDP